MLCVNMMDELQNPIASPVLGVRLENIWSYDHFADALFSYFDALKRRNPRYTLNAWSKKLGEKNSGNLVHYFKRRRAPTAEMTERLVAAMHLDEREAEYFRLLVARARSQSAWANKLEHQSKINAYRLAHQGSEIDLKRFSTLSSPLHLAIREIVFNHEVGVTPEGVQRKLRVSVPMEQIQVILADLIHVGFITRSENGSYSRKLDFLPTSAEAPPDAIKLYDQRSLNDYIDAIYSVPVEQRHFEGAMISIPSSKIPEAKKAIEEFMSSFAVQFSQSYAPSNQIYQIHALFSPWSQS